MFLGENYILTEHQKEAAGCRFNHLSLMRMIQMCLVLFLAILYHNF